MLRSPMGGVAALSVLALITVAGWQLYVQSHPASGGLASVSQNATSSLIAMGDTPLAQELALFGLSTDVTTVGTSSTDTVAMIGPLVVAQLAGEYAGLAEAGTNSPDNLDAAAQSIARNVRAVLEYKTYTQADIKTDSITSYDRMLTYRSDMRAALEPLLQNSDAELNLYAKYIETGDTTYLDTLATAAKNYRLALEAATKVVVPKDAVNYQRDILNALSYFTVVIDAMATHPGDAITSAALLRTFNDAELSMYTSFNNLSAYYAQKTP